MGRIRMRHCGRSIWWNCYASRRVRSDTKDYYSAPGFGSRLVTGKAEGLADSALRYTRSLNE